MKHADTAFVFDLRKDGIQKIEHFVDFICDQLLINETYSGNILISLNEFFNLAKTITVKGIINIEYLTDYQKIRIYLQPVDNQIIKLLNEKIKVEETEGNLINKSVYLLKALVDEIEINDSNAITFLFDISALHNKVYAHRSSALSSYFEQARIKMAKSNDSV